MEERDVRKRGRATVKLCRHASISGATANGCTCQWRWDGQSSRWHEEKKKVQEEQEYNRRRIEIGGLSSLEWDLNIPVLLPLHGDRSLDRREMVYIVYYDVTCGAREALDKCNLSTTEDSHRQPQDDQIRRYSRGAFDS